MKSLQTAGLGNDPKKVDVISQLVEDELWRTDILGDKTPRQLLRTLIYVLGVNLALRTGEHRLLRREMFQVTTL